MTRTLNILRFKILGLLCLLLLCLLLLGAVLKPCHAQAVYVPPAPTISSIPGLTAALQKSTASLPTTLSSQPVSYLVGQYHATQVAAFSTSAAVFSRHKYVLPAGALSVAPLFTNFWMNTNGEVAITGPLLISCVVEDSNGNLFPCSFNGSYVGTLTKKGPLVASPVNLFVAAGGTIWVRTYVTLPSTGADFQIQSEVSGDYSTVAPSTTDPLTAATAGGSDPGYLFGPTSIVGLAPAGTRSVNVYGDSISVAAPSYIYDTLSGIMPFVHFGYSGTAFLGLLAPTGQTRLAMIPYATHTYIAYGTNDFRGSTGLTAQNLIDRCTAVASQVVAVGNKPVIATILPFALNQPAQISSFCDNQSAQVLQSNDAARRAYNDWVRGVPLATINAGYGITLSATTKTPIGLGVTSPPVDFASILETNVANVAPVISSSAIQSGGGYYRVPSSPYYTGTSTGGTTGTVTGSTFGSTSMASMIIKFTSGANSGVYATVSSSTTSSIAFYAAQNAAGTTATITAPASGDTFVVYAVYTYDGTHPASNAINGYPTIHNSGLFTTATFN